VSYRFTEASSADADRMREIYEQALEAAGMDVAGGAAVWAAARAYEAKQLEAAPADARAALMEVRVSVTSISPCERQSPYECSQLHSACGGARSSAVGSLERRLLDQREDGHLLPPYLI